MKTKNSRERTKTGKNNDRPSYGKSRSTTKSEGYRGRTKPEDSCIATKPEGYRGRAKAEDSRSESKPEAYRGRGKPEDSRGATRTESYRGREKPEDSRGTTRPDSYRGRAKTEDSRGATKPDSYRGRGKPGDSRGATRPESGGVRSKTWENREEVGRGEFDERMNPDLLIGRNPVAEALKSGRTIEKIYVAKGTTGSIIKILGEAKDKGVPIIYTEKLGLDRIAGCEQHQGIIAQVTSYIYKTIEDIFSLAKERGEEPFVVVLDNIEDPHNLGAIIRSAEGAGAHGVIIPKRNGVGVTQTVAKASSGAIEYLPIVKVTNIGETLQRLKKEGLWVAACDMGGTEYYHQNLKGPMALVIGSEGAGIGRLIKERCDFVVSIPMKGQVASLNASNAAAILLYEIRKQRDE